MPVKPPDEVLKEVPQKLCAKNPTLGTAKLHSQSLIEHPGWSVSEKRVKKLLASEVLLVTLRPPKNKLKNGTAAKDGGTKLFPMSKVIESLDVARWARKLRLSTCIKRKRSGCDRGYQRRKGG